VAVIAAHLAPGRPLTVWARIPMSRHVISMSPYAILQPSRYMPGVGDVQARRPTHEDESQIQVPPSCGFPGTGPQSISRP